jgi:ABC-type phosphate transport system substrate-binding protein
MHMQKLTIIALVACCGFLWAEDVAIVNPATGVSALSSDQVKDLFLGKKSSWDDGSKVVVVVAKEGPGATSLMKLLGKSDQQFQTAWKKLIFTGKGSMPEMVDSDDAVVAFVAKTPGSIGFVDKAKAKDGVKAIPVP